MFGVFDIGGTKMRVGVSADGENLAGTNVATTPTNFEDGVTTLQEMFRELSSGKEIRALAGGITGVLNSSHTELLSSPHLAGWINKPLADRLLGVTNGGPVMIENDSATVGLGEAHFGAGRGKGIVAYITVSTGVGGARIVDGKIDRTASGFEPGHQIIDLSENLTLEDAVSGTAIEKKYGRKAFEIDDPEIWKEVSQKFSVGVYNTILNWSPEVVVLGGSMFRQPGIDLDVVKTSLQNQNKVLPELPEIKQATLGDQGGLFGGLILATNKF